jgi:phosphosulfolactate phosphohydrolase-like enzyme
MPPEAVAGGIAVVIDVIRASTTIITALANNAAGVIPTAAIETARAQAASLGSTTLLGGERGGIRIDGFHLGNSPREYTQDRVAGHLIVFTTTNGTAALAACEPAAVAMIGSLVNRTAVATAARTAAQRHNSVVHLVCAGVERLVADEDLLGAGAIIDAAQTLFPGDQFDEPAIDARERFLAAVGHQSGAAAIETPTSRAQQCRQTSLTRSMTGWPRSLHSDYTPPHETASRPNAYGPHRFARQAARVHFPVE